MDSSVENTASQIFFQPALFASEVTDVRHLYHSQESQCDHVQCGKNSQCRLGVCYCNSGFYPPGPSESPFDCTTAQTQAGCKCSAFWSRSEWTTSHYGCPRSTGQCVVDTSDVTFETCSKKLKTSGPQRAGLTGAIMGVFMSNGKAKQVMDFCRPLASNGIVPSMK